MQQGRVRRGLHLADVTVLELDRVLLQGREVAAAVVDRHTGREGDALLNLLALVHLGQLLGDELDGPRGRIYLIKELLESGPVRCLRVLSFLRAVRPGLVYDAVKITDPYGPAIVDPELEAIVVSRETASGGAACNKKRLENGLNEMHVYTTGLMGKSTENSTLDAEADMKDKISSSDIR